MSSEGSYPCLQLDVSFTDLFESLTAPLRIKGFSNPPAPTPYHESSTHNCAALGFRRDTDVSVASCP